MYLQHTPSHMSYLSTAVFLSTRWGDRGLIPRRLCKTYCSGKGRGPRCSSNSEYIFICRFCFKGCRRKKLWRYIKLFGVFCYGVRSLVYTNMVLIHNGTLRNGNYTSIRFLVVRFKTVHYNTVRYKTVQWYKTVHYKTVHRPNGILNNSTLQSQNYTNPWTS